MPRRAEKGAAAQAIGHSRGGRTTKIHAIADGRGHLLAFLPSLAPPGRFFLGDKGYDARSLRETAAQRGPLAVISDNATRKLPFPFDKTRYAARNVIERMFCRLKDFHRIATRYDLLARDFASAVALVAAILWWA